MKEVSIYYSRCYGDKGKGRRRVRQRGLLIAIGINEEGYREVLGFMVGDSESEESWGEFSHGLTKGITWS